jgi:hypothetical protein
MEVLGAMSWQMVICSTAAAGRGLSNVKKIREIK